MRNGLTQQSIKINFDLDVDFYLQTLIRKTSIKLVSDPPHIIGGC